MPAATVHATIRHHASGLRAARAHVAHLFLRSGGSYGTCFVLFVCAKQMTPIMWPASGAPLLIQSALSALDASCDCACYDQAWRIGAASGPCARCAPTGGIGRLLAHLFCTFVCEANDTDYYYVACFWCSFADSDCAFCAGCQLRLRMLRSGMMHRGCGRPVRTLRTFCDDRAAPMAPVLHFLCAKEMTPIMLACFWVLLC